MRFDLGNAMLVLSGNGEEQRSNARLHIEFETGNDDGHTQCMRPNALATAELAVAVGAPSVLNG